MRKMYLRIRSCRKASRAPLGSGPSELAMRLLGESS
jgi:hypothetical protein